MSVQNDVPEITIIQGKNAKGIVQVGQGVVAVVGTFSKGPLNTPTVTYSLQQVINKFGDDAAGLTGIKTARGVWNQQPKSVIIVRIGAAAQLKAATLILEGANAIPSVLVTALQMGTDGDNIAVEILAGTANNSFKINVYYKNVLKETFDNLTLANLQVNSQYIQLSQEAGAASVPIPMAKTALAGGNDGANTADGDYVGAIDGTGNRTGLTCLELMPVNIVTCAQQTSQAVQQGLIDHCNKFTVQDGVRIAVSSIAKDVYVSQAPAKQMFNEKRLIMSYNWIQPEEDPTNYVSPDGYYAGLLGAIRACESPSNRVVQGVAGVQYTLTSDDLATLTQARISPVNYERATGDFRIANGLNTSTYDPNGPDDDWTQISVLREDDKLQTEIYYTLIPDKSQNIDDNLMLTVAAQVDQLLEDHKQKGEIADYQKTVCDRTINTPDTIKQRLLQVAVNVAYLEPGDFIQVTMSRFVA